MKFFAFIAGFFRNAAPESSTRLVGIMAAAVGLALAGVLIVTSCTGADLQRRTITWTDIVVVACVFAYSCTALGLRSPFPPEMMIAGFKGVTLATTTETTKVEQTATAAVATN